MNSTEITSNDPEALLAFTIYTVEHLLKSSHPMPTTCSRHPRRLPPIGQFIRELYSDPNVGMTKKKTHSLTCAVKLFALIYLYRLKSKLPKHARGGADTPYRLILAALLTSSKYLSETGTGLTSLQLSQLSQSVFTANEINQMERSFLGLLKYDLWVSAGDIQSFMRLYGYTLHMDVYHVNLLRLPTFHKEQQQEQQQRQPPWIRHEKKSSTRLPSLVVKTGPAEQRMASTSSSTLAHAIVSSTTKQASPPPVMGVDTRATHTTTTPISPHPA